MKPFYQLKVKDDNAELYIYGDIASDGYKWSESDISASDIVRQLKGLNAKKIDVYINSYGGEVAQGVAIYNVLKRHNAKVTTYVDGFACSIASVIAMAGDVRKMYDNSLLMIHNAWTVAQGNAEELFKQAEDLKTINEAVVRAYLDVVNISEDELTELLNAETWITAEKAVEMGFATEVVAAKKPTKASANAQSALFALLAKAQENPEEEEKGGNPEETPEEKPEEETPEEKPEEENPEDEKTELEKILANVVSRLEKLEKEVFKEEEEGGNPEEEETPEEKPENNNVNNAFMNFLKEIS